MAERSLYKTVERSSHTKSSMALSEKQKKEINRQKYFTAVALVLMLVVIVCTFWMVG
jgi:hypothetical protein